MQRLVGFSSSVESGALNATAPGDRIVHLSKAKPGDFLMNHVNIVPAMNHLLGPKTAISREICHTLVFSDTRKILGSNQDDDHCSKCEDPNKRWRI